MREDILEFLEKEVYSRCKQATNKFGMSGYNHIVSVVKNTKLLAGLLGADSEIVQIAAWLHDIASVTDISLHSEHHIYGAQIAHDLLTSLKYDEEKIKLVQKCIINHRGSVNCERECAEERCLADADAISHFDNIPGLFYLAYVTKNLEIDQGAEFVKNKLKRSYNKLSFKSKEFYKEKIGIVLEIFNRD